MPELPEVETVVRDLNKKIKNKKILDVWTDWPKPFRRFGGGFDNFKKEIKGKTVTSVRRIGKNIIFDLSPKHPAKAGATGQAGGKIMLIHLKMTGHLLLGRWVLENGKWIAAKKGPLQERVNGYIHVMFWLGGNQMMGFSDLRKFGKIILADKKNFQNLEDIKDVGPDPLKISFAKFKEAITKKRGPIKKILMDQGVVSGIGNIYGDEILFVARIHPLARTEKLTEKDLENIFRATQKILKKAIQLRGTSTSDFRDTKGRAGSYGNVRLVYQKTGKKCPRKCGGKIERVKINNRSAHFCPSCQKL